MKKFVAFLLAALMVLATAACAAPAQTTEPAAQTQTEGTTPAEDTTPAEKPYEGTTITIVTTSSGPFLAAQDGGIDQFEAETGIKVNLELYEFQEAIDKININAAAGGSDIDVICYRPIQETATWYANGYFANLNDYIAAAGDDYDYEDFFPAAREVTTVDGNIVGIPYLTEGEILWYNTEIFERYNATVPTTFDELLETAKALYDPANNVYGISLRGEGNSAVTQFSGFLYGFGGDFFDENMNATMNTPEALQALEYYADLCAYGPDGAASASQADGINWFNTGITAMRIDAYAQNWNHADPERSLVYDKLGFANFPTGPIGEDTPYNIVAWAMGISATSKNQGAAWEFIKFLTGKEMDVQAMLHNGFSARTSTWADARVAEVVDPGLMEVIQHTGEVGRPYDRPHNANASEVRAIVGQMIDLAQSGLRGEELAAAVEPLNTQIQTILDSEK